MRRLFVYGEHEEFGSMGFRPKNMPGFDPLGGMGVAHDMLEHPAKPDESVAGEIRAFGAMMYVRGSQYFHLKGKVHTQPSYHFSGEMAELLMKIHRGELEPIADCPVTGKMYDSYIMDELDSAIEYIQAHLLSEYEPEDQYKLTPADIRNIRGWLAYGYREAKKRYYGISRDELRKVFCAIETKVDHYLSHCEDLIEGQELIVSLRWVKAYEGERRAQLSIQLRGEDL